MTNQGNSMSERPPVCDYEGSDYQSAFWDQGGRAYEDRCEALALKRLLPKGGHLLLELGAGAGRNTHRYAGFDKMVLLDYSRTQLQQAQARLGSGERYLYIAADIYRLPFVDGLFDAATMIRTLHHMADPSAALRQVHNILQPNGVFILEYANKQNLKAILRYIFRRQAWSPFSLEPVEFAALNFDFHPRAVHGILTKLGFQIDKIRTVSHFRIGLLKKIVPVSLLAMLDVLIQPTGAYFQFSPSVFLRARASEGKHTAAVGDFFKCPQCNHAPLVDHKDHLACPGCRAEWSFEGGIYDFKTPRR
ncbi:MAG: class I SAM-dependent methyltransferase [Chloroflexota bacterium]